MPKSKQRYLGSVNSLPTKSSNSASQWTLGRARGARLTTMVRISGTENLQGKFHRPSTIRKTSLKVLLHQRDHLIAGRVKCDKATSKHTL